MYGVQRSQKPPVGAQLDPSAALARGLLCFYPLNEGTGPAAYDAARNGPMLAAIGFGAQNPWGAGPSGPGVLCQVSGSTPHFSGSLPVSLQVPLPVTIAAGLRPLGAPGGQILWGCDTAVDCWVLKNDPSTGQWRLGTNTGGTQTDWVSGVSLAPSIGQDVVAAGEFTTSGYKLYLNGQLAASQVTTLGPISYPNPTALSVGAPAANQNTLLYWAAAWNRTLLPSEHAALAANPWQVFRPRGELARLYAAISGSRVSYSRGSSILRPFHLPTADLSCHLD